MARLAWLTALTIYLALPLFAQQAQPPQSTPPASAPQLIPRSQDERERTYQIEHHVVLNVFVADQHGDPVEGLTQDDFTLLDNQQPQKIASFQAVHGEAAIAPVHIMLVLDTLNSSASDLAKERAGVTKFLTQPGRLAYPVSIVRLTDYGATVSQSSQDSNALLSELKNLTTHARPTDSAQTGAERDSEPVFLRLPGAPPVPLLSR